MSFTPPSDLELAAIMASKICHDIISPVGATRSALEMIRPGMSENERRPMDDLITGSTHSAIKKLEFCRLAYGASGSVSAPVDLTEAEKVATSYTHDERTTLDWAMPVAVVEKNVAKLALIMMATGKESVPRGGTVRVEASSVEKPVSITVTAKGVRVLVPPHLETIVARRFDDGVTGRNAQFYYMLRLAEDLGVTLSMECNEDSFVLRAAP
ncbi:MAG: hypothetical protein KDI98_08010 [Hyphomicrobiaceae bacterium]|nr:hypothetical protein [Hyphomicrobiaceae bacterium]